MRSQRYEKVYNIMFLKNIATLAILGFISLNTSAQAKENGSDFYAGLGIATISAEEKGASSEEMGANVIGGYTYSKYLSGEISLFNLGDHKELGMKGNGASLSVIASYPITNSFSLFGELGGMTIDLDIDESRNLANTSLDKESLQDGRDSSLYYAIGAKYKVDNWSFVIKTARVDLDADMDMIMAQVHYHF